MGAGFPSPTERGEAADVQLWSIAPARYPRVVTEVKRHEQNFSLLALYVMHIPENN